MSTGISCAWDIMKLLIALANRNVNRKNSADVFKSTVNTEVFNQRQTASSCLPPAVCNSGVAAEYHDTALERN